MPIYEFYCPACHTVFSFFSAGVNPEARPSCPRCGRSELGRRPSTFATLRRSVGTTEEGGEEEGPFADLDEERFEGAMESVLGEMDEGAEDDPRQMARLLRRFTEAAGMAPGPRMEEMMRRLEAGEDPEALEDELGDDLGDEDEALGEFFQAKKAARARRAGKPRVDKELYFL
jgi:putative FmdB family regulatory protein